MFVDVPYQIKYTGKYIRAAGHAHTASWLAEQENELKLRIFLSL